MKKSLFYGFITLLLTALCIVSGVTYAYFSAEQSFNGSVNNEEVKLDLSLSNLVVKETYSKLSDDGYTFINTEIVKDPNNLDSGFKISINNDTLTIGIGEESGVDYQYCKIYFDITVKNNTHTSISYYYDYQFLNGKNYSDGLNIDIDTDKKTKKENYIINPNESRTVKCYLQLSRTYYIANIKDYFVINNDFKNQYCIKFYTNTYLNNSDLNKYNYIGNVIDEYYGIYNVETTDQFINCLSLSKDCPFYIYNKNSQFKLRKINPDEKSFIKVEKIKSSKYNSKDNYLSYKVSFKNLYIDESNSIQIATFIPNLNCTDNEINNDFHDFYYYSENLSGGNKDINKYMTNSIISTSFEYDKDNFISCKDEYKEIFKGEFYFCKGGL